jgi:hypothetical protein
MSFVREMHLESTWELKVSTEHGFGMTDETLLISLYCLVHINFVSAWPVVFIYSVKFVLHALITENNLHYGRRYNELLSEVPPAPQTGVPKPQVFSTPISPVNKVSEQHDDVLLCVACNKDVSLLYIFNILFMS